MGVSDYIVVGVIIVFVVGGIIAMLMYPSYEQHKYGVTIRHRSETMIYEIPHFDNYRVAVSLYSGYPRCSFNVTEGKIIEKCTGDYYIYEPNKGQWVGPSTVVTVIDLWNKKMLKYIDIHGNHNEVLESVKIKNSTIHIVRVPIIFPRERTISLLRNGTLEFRVKIVINSNVPEVDRRFARHMIVNATKDWCTLLSKVTGLPCRAEFVNDTSWNVEFIVYSKYGRSSERMENGRAVIAFLSSYNRGTALHELGHTLGLVDLYNEQCTESRVLCEIWNASVMNSAGSLTVEDVAAAALNLAYTISKTNPQIANEIIHNLMKYGVRNNTILVITDAKGHVLFPLWLTGPFGYAHTDVLECMKVLAQYYYGSK